ncbi:MAG: alpha/beta fold hydrolase [Propionibacteriaceae bacterium]|nr:alpha/beta fold hydrolase [Propionibacteriaceae bacterium]
MTGLYTTRVGEGPIRYAFCHGLFGRGRNWTSIARALRPAASLLIDLPNHGQSPHTDRFSYPAMADAIAATLAAADSDDLTLVGHSMGGRAAMLTALAYPELVGRLVVVDVAPAPTPVPEFARYAATLLNLKDEAMRDRATATAALATSIHDPRIRDFLMTGFQSTPGGGRWRFNLPVLARDLDLVLDWPDPRPVTPYEGPVLWLAGAESTYVTPASYATMRELFPHYDLVTIQGAGHWIHADQPEAFLEALTRPV